jgi:hypothetical protein
MSLLHDLIGKNDWITFVDRWHSTRISMERDALSSFLNGFVGTLWSAWGGHINTANSKRDRKHTTQAERNFGWLLHFAVQLVKRKTSLDKYAIEVINFAQNVYEKDLMRRVHKPVVLPDSLKGRIRFILSVLNHRVKHWIRRVFRKVWKRKETTAKSELLLVGLSNPIYLFAIAPDVLIRDSRKKRELKYSRFSKKLVEWTRISLAGKIHDDVMKKYEEIVKEDISFQKAGEYILNLLHAAYDNNKPTGFWVLPKGYDDDEPFFIEKFHERIKDHDSEWRFAFRLYLNEGDESSKLKTLARKRWKPYLQQSPVKEYIKDILEGRVQASPEYFEKVKEVSQG